jgi:hypothetical protein
MALPAQLSGHTRHPHVATRGRRRETAQSKRYQSSLEVGGLRGAAPGTLYRRRGLNPLANFRLKASRRRSGSGGHEHSPWGLVAAVPADARFALPCGVDHARSRPPDGHDRRDRNVMRVDTARTVAEADRTG